MLDGHGGELATKDRNAQRENLIYSSPDRTGIYFIGSIYLVYVYIRKIEGVEPATPIFFQGYWARSRFGAGCARRASWHENASCTSSTRHSWILGEARNDIYMY